MPAVPFLLAGAAFSGAAATIGTAIAATITTAAVSTAVATAIGVGTLSAVATAVQGGSVSDVLKSAVVGGLTSYVGGTVAADIGTTVAQDAFFSAIDAGFASSASIAASEFAGSAITGAITSSFNALLNERDPIEAFIKGGLSAGVSSAVSSAVNEVIKDVPGLEQIRGTAAGSAVERALKTSIANAILTNKDFDQSFIESLAGSGANYLLNTAQSTLKDFGSNLLNDSELVKNSEEQVDGLINREKDLVTTINNYIPEVQGIANSIKENETTQNAWAAEANSLIPTLQNLESRANSVTAMANEMNGPYGFNHWAVQKNPSRFLTDRVGGTYGKYYFGVEEYLVESEADGSFYSYPASRIVVVNNDTGARLYDYQQLINDVNANAAYINNTFPSVKSQFDNAINNLNGAKVQYSNLVDYYNNAKSTLDGYKTELDQVRTDYNAALETFNANYAKYEATLQNFITTEAENAQIIDKLIRDSAQVISSYEEDYGVKPTSQQLADLAASGNGDLAKGFESFDANNVSAKEAKEFLEASGYKPTDEEIQQFVKQENEQVIKDNIASYLNDKRSADTTEGIRGFNKWISTGADTVNAGVAQNDVLDLIQRDIDTSVANNTQGTLNAEQDLGIPPIDPRIAAQGVAGGQFGEGELLQAGAQIPVNRLQELMQIRPDLVTMSDTGTYLVTVPQSDGAYTNYEISASGQVLSATPGVSVGPGKDPSKAASALEDVIKIEEGRSSTQAVPEGSGSSGSVQQKATDLSPAAQETLLQIGGVLGLGEQDPDAVYEALIGGASGGIGDVALLGYDQLTKLQDEIELIFDEPNLPADARSEIARIYAEVTDQKRIQEEAIRDQLLNDQKPTEQQVADTGLTVVGQPVDQTPVVSPTAPSVTTPTTSPVVTEPVVTQPVVPEPVVTQPPVNEPVVTEPVVTEPLITQPVITQPVVTTPPVLTPEQIAAQELDAEVQKIMRMAVKKDPVDMRYDLNKDGRVNVIDALALKRGQATVPTVEEYQASLAQQTVAPQPEIVEPPITQPAVTEPVTQEPPTQDIVTTAPSTTPPVTQPVEQTPSVEPPPPPPIVEPTPPTSEVTGIVLQNNGDGTALVLTNDGNATNVPVTDAVSNEPLTPGASVTVDQNTNTATITPPVTNVVTPEPVTPVPPTVQDTGNQQVIGGGQEPTTDAGTVINTPIGPDTYTPPTPEPVVPEPPPPPPEVPTTPQEPITQPPQEPTEEDLLLEQIIQELETKPPVSEGVSIPEPEFPEPPLVLPESPTINVGDSLTVRPRVERRATRPSVPPGSRVEESAQILPIRPGLSEGGTGGIEGTTEQEQEPVWNVRSLKLRRLLGI